MNRRTLLKTAGLVPFLTGPDLIAAPNPARPAGAVRKRSVRFAYLGDT
ncbi:MAG: hypothetical protein H7Z72_05940, partial [Bacteroidetes bacterium]|nr:hypothetical protein [Fibrella sp.]